VSDLLPRGWNDEPIEIALIDDLATVLSRTVVGWESVIGIDLSRQPEVVRVMARYRAYKEHPDPEPRAEDFPQEYDN
jgi:hypothetical protein